MPGLRPEERKSFERALRRFKKRQTKMGLLRELRKHQHFEKPSERKKRKRAAANRKLRKLRWRNDATTRLGTDR